jgi:hypothetical protein
MFTTGVMEYTVSEGRDHMTADMECTVSEGCDPIIVDVKVTVKLDNMLYLSDSGRLVDLIMRNNTGK